MENPRQNGIRYSVVIPLYNKERHVERALRSAMRQTVSPLEIIVVDDGSTDRGAEVVEGISKEDVRISLIRQPNGGVSRARNTGIDASKGTHVAFLDADDEWKLGFLETISRLIQRYPDAGSYSTSYDVVKGNGRRTRSRFFSLNPSKDFLFRNYFKAGFRGSLIWTSATVVPKRTFDRSGVFLDGGGRGQDLDLWWRIGAWFDVAFSRARMAVYYMDADNRSDKRKRKPSETSQTTGRWWAVDRLDELSKDSSILPDRRKWMCELVLWNDILAAYNRFSRGKKDHGLWRILGASFGRHAFFYSILRLVPRYLLRR